MTIGDYFIYIYFILMLKSYGLVYLDYNVSSGPFLSFEIEIGDGPGPELDNNIITRNYSLSCVGLERDNKGEQCGHYKEEEDCDYR